MALNGKKSSLRFRFLAGAVLPVILLISLFSPLFSQPAYAVDRTEVLRKAQAWSILNALLRNADLLENDIDPEDYVKCDIWGGVDKDAVYVGHHSTGSTDGGNSTWGDLEESGFTRGKEALAAVGIDSSEGCRGLLLLLGYSFSNGSLVAPNFAKNDANLTKRLADATRGKFFGSTIGDPRPHKAISYMILYEHLVGVCGWKYRHAFNLTSPTDQERSHNDEARQNNWAGTTPGAHYHTYTYEGSTAQDNTYQKIGGITGEIRMGPLVGYAFGSPDDAGYIYCGSQTDNAVGSVLNKNKDLADAYYNVLRPGGDFTPGTCGDRYANSPDERAACDEGFNNKAAGPSYCDKYPGPDLKLQNACKYGVGTATGGGNVTTPGTPAQSGQANQTQSCGIQDMGWFLCPVFNFMAEMTDALYSFVEELLIVQPIDLSTSAPLYKAWEVMRNLANVAFVIVFLIVIFSQVSNIGINNYGIKKILPRLIMAAIFVNISYWMCAVAVDLSNIIGGSLMSIFDNIEETLNLPPVVVQQGTLWTETMGTVLAGGTAAIIAIAFLGPLLTLSLVAAIVTVAVLIARQVLIILLIVISPIAFIALLLPNTQAQFRGWLNMFQTMLLLYPLIALVFGASALAQVIILANA